MRTNHSSLLIIQKVKEEDLYPEQWPERPREV